MTYFGKFVVTTVILIAALVTVFSFGPDYLPYSLLLMIIIVQLNLIYNAMPTNA